MLNEPVYMKWQTDEQRKQFRMYCTENMTKGYEVILKALIACKIVDKAPTENEEIKQRLPLMSEDEKQECIKKRYEREMGVRVKPENWPNIWKELPIVRPDIYAKVKLPE